MTSIPPLARLLCASAALAAAPLAAAQQSTPTPSASPAPVRTPSIITLPGGSADRFTLGTPTPAPLPVPRPVATAAPAQATPTPRPTPTSAARPTPAASAAARPSPTPSATPSPTPSPSGTSTPEASPTAMPSATPVAVPVPGPVAERIASERPAWQWMVAGAAITAVVFGLAFLLFRRRPRREEEEEEVFEVAAPVPPPPPPAPAPVPAAPVAPTGEPFDVQILPRRIDIDGQRVLLDVELLVTNLQSGAAENVKIDLTMISASPDQDRYIAAYHGNRLLAEGAQPFDIAAGASRGLSAGVTLPRDQLHRVEVGGRPLFVPLVMIDLRWRAGISLRRFGIDFMVGTSGQGDKLGPIWLDRPQAAARLAATRYLPRQPG